MRNEVKSEQLLYKFCITHSHYKTEKLITSQEWILDLRKIIQVIQWTIKHIATNCTRNSIQRRKM